MNLLWSLLATTADGSWILNPADSDSPSQGASEIREVKTAYLERLKNEHFTYTGDSTNGAPLLDGTHREGSAVAYYADAEPTTRPNASTNLSSTDAGRLWIDSDDSILYYYDGSDWKAVGPLEGARTVVLANQTTAQAMADGAWTTVIFNVEDDDILKEYNATTGAFVPATTGYYHIDGRVMSAGTTWTAGDRWVLGFWYGATQLIAGTYSYPDVAYERFLDSQVSGIVSLTAGESYYFKLFQDSAGAVNSLGEAAYNQMSIHRVI